MNYQKDLYGRAARKPEPFFPENSTGDKYMEIELDIGHW